jgi:hypothetical protein
MFRVLLVFVLGILCAGCAQQQQPPAEPIAMQRPPAVVKPADTPKTALVAPAATPPATKAAPAAPLSVSAAKPAPTSHCQGRSALTCSASAGCAWTSGYTTSAGVKVSAYCHTSTAKAPKPVTAKASKPVAYKSNCHWVSGYTRKNGTRVAGYQRCRR